MVYLYMKATGDVTLKAGWTQLGMTNQNLAWAESLLKRWALIDGLVPKARFDRRRLRYTGEEVTAFSARRPRISAAAGRGQPLRMGGSLTGEGWHSATPCPCGIT